MKNGRKECLCYPGTRSTYVCTRLLRLVQGYHAIVLRCCMDTSSLPLCLCGFALRLLAHIAETGKRPLEFCLRELGDTSVVLQSCKHWSACTGCARLDDARIFLARFNDPLVSNHVTAKTLASSCATTPTPNDNQDHEAPYFPQCCMAKQGAGANIPIAMA